MRRIAQDDGFSLMPGKNCQRMTEHLQSPSATQGFLFQARSHEWRGRKEGLRIPVFAEMAASRSD